MVAAVSPVKEQLKRLNERYALPIYQADQRPSLGPINFGSNFYAPVAVEPLPIASLLPVTDVGMSGRDAVKRYEDMLIQLPQLDMPVEHFFGDGVYVRKLILPKGACATGRIHKYDHVSIVVSGDMTIWTEESGVHRVTGHSVVEVKAGMKRAGVAHEDTVWLTAHRMDRLSPSEIVDFLTVVTYDEYEAYCRNKSVERLSL